MKQTSEHQLLELFGGIEAPRKAFKRMNIPHKLIDYVEWADNRVRAYNCNEFF
jgi:DNA (cytosine-5)-methyltransferase 1